MTVEAQINQYIAEQSPPKSEEIQHLHQRILKASPNCKLWFLDGRNEEGKIVTNPNIGYGSYLQTYANGESRDFYRVGVSANTAGLSVYIMGTENKAFLAETYGGRLGKAKITGYCIKFRRLDDIDLDVLEEAITRRMTAAS